MHTMHAFVIDNLGKTCLALTVFEIAKPESKKWQNQSVKSFLLHFLILKDGAFLSPNTTITAHLQS